ncbi:hypothetical protein Tcan_14890 [Toxocara canis]|uniref:Uncharacterized protein n=1 Tax=Toxocara canis TaxID=6265 RepID=A0A0B2V0Y1_TOXCA|nr:hypothetical protein Tcan_14890 [Toxocara canis]
MRPVDAAIFCCIWSGIVGLRLSDESRARRYSLPFSGPDFANLRRYGDEAKLLSPLVVSDRSGGLLARDFVVLLPSDRGGRNESLAGRSVLANSPSRFRDWLKIGWHW